MPALVVDVGRLELALVNLLSNAIKYCDPAKTAVVRRGHRARAGQRRRAKSACATTASAFPRNTIARDLPALHARARRSRRPRQRSPASGSGLAIVDDCVIAMNGTITVESTEGVGTTFCMTLPATPVTWHASDLLKPIARNAGTLDRRASRGSSSSRLRTPRPSGRTVRTILGDQADLAALIELELAQALAADKRGLAIADHAAQVQLHLRKRPHPPRQLACPFLFDAAKHLDLHAGLGALPSAARSSDRRSGRCRRSAAPSSRPR